MAAFSQFDPDLEALWFFESSLSDQMGQNGLTPFGSIAYNASQFAQGAYSLEFSAGEYVFRNDADLAGIDFSSDFSVGGYARVTSEPNDSKFISKWNSSINAREFELIRESSDGSISVSMSSDGTSTNRIDLSAGAATWPLNTWIHLVVTFDATTHIIRLYVDGSEVTTGSFPYTWTDVPFSGSAPLCIGGSSNDSTRSLIGQVDEVFIVSRVLTSTEISGICNDGFTTTPAPYGPSSVITGISFNFSSIINLADGSDNWPVTWADNGHQYTSWGDGGGFGGSDSLGRVSVGVGRVEGTKASYSGYNVNGGYNPENPSDLPNGKSHGIISIGGDLFMFLDGNGSDVNGFNGNQLYKSTDHGATWSAVSGVSWAPSDFTPQLPRPWCFTFCQFGQDYAGARDAYVYIALSEVQDDTSWEVQTPGEITLARVPVSQIETKSAYEFFSGTAGSPAWSSDIADRQPVWQDSINGVMRISISYNAYADRYLLTCQQNSRFVSNGAYIGIYDAPEPWGPWTTVLFDDAYSYGLADETKTVFWNFSNKWASGNNFVLVGTLLGDDQWGSIEGAFTVAGTTYNQSVSGNMPAAAAGLSFLATFRASIAGDMPAAQGALLKKIIKRLSGSCPAQSATLAKLISRRMSGDVPQPCGALIKNTGKGLSGDMPAASGGISAATSTMVQPVLGAFPPAAGGVVKKTGKSVAGNMPTADGVTAKKTGKAVSGNVQNPFGALAKRSGKVLSGNMPAASGGIISAAINTVQSVFGAFPAAAGGVVKKIGKSVFGLMPAAGAEAAKKTRKAVAGDMPQAGGGSQAGWRTLQSIFGDMPAPSGWVSTVLNPIVAATVKAVKIIGSGFKKLLG